MLSLDTAEPIETAPARTVTDPIHFSDLVSFDLSPAHFKASVAQKWEPTTEMLVGTIVHHLVLGPHRTKPLVRYSGDERKGNAWKDFQRETLAANPKAEIVTAKEWARAEPIAQSVLADPVARELIEGARREVSLTWESGGVKCETDGIDLVGDGYIADLKRTSCTEPAGFARHAVKHWWHAQLAFYEEAANANQWATGRGLFLIGVEPQPPYAVTVMRCSQGILEHGRRAITKWIERYRVCVAENHWPAYTQRVVEFDLLPWMVEEGGDDDG
jgi:hypothetical protein